MGFRCVGDDGKVGVLMAREYTNLNRIHRPSETNRVVGAPWGDAVADNFDFFLRGRPAAVVRGSAVSIPHTTITPISFDVVLRDNYGMFDLSTTDRLTIPIDGVYVFGGSVSFSTGGFTSLTRGLVQIGNLTTGDDYSRSEPNVNSMVFTALCAHTAVEASAGDEIALEVYHTGSGVDHLITPLSFWCMYLRGGT